MTEDSATTNQAAEAGELMHATPPAIVEELARMTPQQIEVAETAMIRAAEALKAITLAAVRRTYPDDWHDFGGKPYLQGKGADRLATVAGIKLDPPIFTEEWVEGECFIDCIVTAHWPQFGRTEQGIGACDTMDKFYRGKEGDSSHYNQALERAGGNETLAKRMLKPNVKKKAFENAKSRAITHCMGLRGITREALESIGFATTTSTDFDSKTPNGGAAAKRAPAARKSPAPATSCDDLGVIQAAAVGSRHRFTGALWGTPKALAKRVSYSVSDGLRQLEVIVWQADPYPWAREGVDVVMTIEVREYKGTRQYIASDVEQVEA